ncbi:zinc-binding dehydrogenase, partial [Rhizobium leguminosarum]|uniref:zinc-binding dehydrogenase n=1 Tax=Rhizobium leguminosarum TaxID=384 RepID=UPI003F9DC247
PNANRRARSVALSSDVTILDPGSSDCLSTIKDGTEEGVGVDAAIECAGHPSALHACRQAVRAQGTVVQVGWMGGPAEI